MSFDENAPNPYLTYQGLFSRHYLERVLKENRGSEELTNEINDAQQRLQQLWEGNHQALTSNINESQTQKRFINPMLTDILGWADFINEERVGRNEPDYALFCSDERHREAQKQSGEEVYRKADAIADAKKWGLKLDLGRDDIKDSEAASAGSPGAQLRRYFQWTGCEWGFITNGAQWRLYTAKVSSAIDTHLTFDVEGIARALTNDSDKKGLEQAKAAFEIFYTLMRGAAFRLDSARRVRLIDDILSEAEDQSVALEDELRRRIFDQVFESLANGLYDDWCSSEDAPATLDANKDLDCVYKGTLILLYRLLFLLYAEERTLLPVQNYRGYYQSSLRKICREAQQKIHQNQVLVKSGLWSDLKDTFEIVSDGEPKLDVPAYNGGLFASDTQVTQWLDSRTLTDEQLAPALTALTMLAPNDPNSKGVDYAALDVRQLGSIYEGLLEHSLVKQEDGTLGLETDKGERKATGSYYTPHYIVEYIVEHTLGPIVDERIDQFEAAMEKIREIQNRYPKDSPGRRSKLSKYEQQAKDAFFTIRVCDPAMGSGHFLVYATDYLTNRIGEVVLNEETTPNPVRDHLAEIREQVQQNLKAKDISIDDIDRRLDDTSLLKRLIMKRCIYGVDLNPMAVELAKVSLWLHSFTVGAPLSFLDHHLKVGNSLIGAEVDTVIEAIQADLFGNIQQEILGGTKFLQDVAFNTDATISDVEESAAAFHAYEDKMEPYKRLLDLWTSQHFDNPKGPTLVRDYAREVIDAYRSGNGTVLTEYPETVATAERTARDKRVFHWELEFPEVYYNLDTSKRRSNPGFDAVVGNPPYVPTEEIDDEDRAFFSKHYESLYRKYDLSAAFLIRSERLINSIGAVAMITPVAWQTGENYSQFREELFCTQSSLMEVINLPFDIFSDAYIDTCILVFGSAKDKSTFSAKSYNKNESISGSGEMEVGHVKIPISYIDDEQKNKIFLRPETYELQRQVQKTETVRFGDITDGCQGIVESFHDYSTTKEKSDQLPYYNCDVYRYQLSVTDQKYIFLDRNSELRKYYTQPRILFRRLVNRQDRLMATYAEKTFVVKKDLNPFVIDRENSLSLLYLLANVNSRLHSHLYVSKSALALKDDFRQTTLGEIRDLPIRDIAFTTPEDERTAHVQALTDAYATAREADADPTANDVLYEVEAHLAGDPGSPDRSPGQAASGTRPERADVVHDLLAHLAREMTRLKRERASYHLNLTDYLAEPEGPASIGLTELGTRYQPAPGVQQSLLADTTSERDGLRIGTLSAERQSDTVIVRATVRYKPKDDENIPDDALDRWGFHETDPVAVCTLHGCTDLESGLLTHWLDVLNAHGSGYSGYRDQATKTNSLLDRLHAARFPDPQDETVLRGLRPFLKNATAAARLDAHLTFTDALIDQIVYRLYGLSDEEVRVVEGTE